MLTMWQKIERKFRKITGRINESHMKTSQIRELVNDFYIYDMPQHLRLLDLESYFRFYTIPNIGYYNLKSILINHNGDVRTVLDYYNSMGTPASIDGENCLHWIIYPDEYKYICKSKEILRTTHASDTTPVSYEINMGKPISPFSVFISVVTLDGTILHIVDKPTQENKGILHREFIYTPEIESTVDYATGIIRMSLDFGLQFGSIINIRAESMQVGKPYSIFRYDNALLLYPIPDKEYQIQLKAMRVPVSLMEEENVSPELNQWWQYIALGAAKKKLEEEDDNERLASIMPAWREQQILVNRTKEFLQQDNRYSILELFPDTYLHGWRGWGCR